jgi:hypothetical protein
MIPDQFSEKRLCGTTGYPGEFPSESLRQCQTIADIPYSAIFSQKDAVAEAGISPLDL